MTKEPIVISFLQEKGGAGKTTMATNIACGIKARGLKVVLVDSDPQGSARDWNEENDGTLIPVIGLDRETLATDIKAVQGYDIVVIDGAPQLTKMAAAAVKASDVVLIPVQPSPYDVWASEPLVDLIKNRQQVMNGVPRAAFIISRAIKRSILSREVNEGLSEYKLPVFKSYTTQLVAYPSSASKGKTVLEMNGSEAAKEINAIVDEIFEEYLAV